MAKMIPSNIKMKPACHHKNYVLSHGHNRDSHMALKSTFLQSWQKYKLCKGFH